MQNPVRRLSLRDGAFPVRPALGFGYGPAVVCSAGMLPRSRRRRLIPACTLAALLVGPLGPLARADGPPVPAPPARDLTAELRELGRRIDADWHLMGAVELGRGVRFNNPFRLATELGSGPESVSLIAPYADLGLAFSYGPPDSIQHGASVHLSVTMAGVTGVAVAPGYQLTYRGPRSFLAYGRIAPIVALAPDLDLGGEIAGGFGWFLTGHLAVAAELVFDTWLGAGTHHVAVATYPVLAGQLGLLVDYELLP